MNKKTLILCISVLSVLALAVAGAVALLYSEKGSESTISDEDMFRAASSSRPLMTAVPSDAAMILHCGSMKEGMAVISDTTWLFRALFSGNGRASFRKFMDDASALLDGKARSFRNAEMAVSMHYSGDIVPLLLVGTSKFSSDTTGDGWALMRAADSAGVAYEIFEDAGEHSAALKKKTVLAFSPSAPLIMSSRRNLDAGTCVLQDHECSAAVSAVGSGAAIFVNNSYSAKLAASFLSSAGRANAGFMKSYASWTGFAVKEFASSGISLSGTSASFDSPAFFSNVFKGIAPGASSVKSVLPAGTLSADALQIADVEAYVSAYRKYVDAIGRLAAYDAALAAVKKDEGISPDVWLEALRVKEICRASVPVADGSADVLLLKAGKEDPVQLFRGEGIRTVKDYDGRTLKSGMFSSVGKLVGRLFAVPDSTYIYKDGWMICGPEEALVAFKAGNRRSLADYLSEIGASDMLRGNGTVFQSYLSASAGPEAFRGMFSRYAAPQAAKMLEGVTACPVVLAVVPGESSPEINISAARAAYAGSVEEEELPAVRDTVVTVPSGPFKVKNCATGKMNTFSQQSNNWLVLKDENGKGLWGVPFSAPICGAVAEIDWFANGKIQFLFASGSSLYLIDRLGRFVKPFPVDLGKDIRIGPAAYDFTGAHGYTALVLHTDNTIGMYDLHGKTPSTWKGIRTEETIKSLPELLRVKGKRFWVVRTSVRTLVFGFDGGNPVYDPQGGKRLRPDAVLKVNDNGTVTAQCYDGKERALKL